MTKIKPPLGPLIISLIDIAKRNASITLSFVLCYSFAVITYNAGGRTGLMVRASDSGSGDPGSILVRVGVFVSLSKRHLLPKSTGNTQE